MQRSIQLLLILLLISFQSFSQKKMEGVVIKNIIGYSVGDSLQILGMRQNDSNETQYLIQEYPNKRFVNEKRIELIDNDNDFWQNAWFKYRAADIVISGWDTNERSILNEEANEYFQNAYQSNIIFENELLYDYIYQIILDIHPLPLNKGLESYFKLVIIKSLDKENFTFDNGMIVLTTGLLAQMESKSDLVDVLINAIAHVTLEHNLINLKQEIRAEKRAQAWGTLAASVTAVAGAYGSIQNDTYFDPSLVADAGLATYFISKSIMESAGANYTIEQNSNVAELKREFFNKNYDFIIQNEEQFLSYMAPVISFTAWQAYHVKNYRFSKELVEKLKVNQLIREDEYLLLSKLSRATSNSEEANIKALDYLILAQEMSEVQLIDLDKEAALLYLRLNDKKNAEIALHNYKNGLMKLSENGTSISKELNEIEQMLHYHNLKITEDSK
ncbi:MAG: M48 family metalloprotease [Bacteroidota bacterium]